MLLSYSEYISYGGKLDDTAFNIYGYEAEVKVQKETHGRIKTATEPIKRCVARLTDIYAQMDLSKDKVTSWSNEGVSKSYKDVSSDDYKSKVKEIISTYLANEVDENGTPLLYLGVC